MHILYHKLRNFGSIISTAEFTILWSIAVIEDQCNAKLWSRLYNYMCKYFRSKKGIYALSLSAGVSFWLVFDFGEGNNFKELDVYFFIKIPKWLCSVCMYFKNLIAKNITYHVMMPHGSRCINIINGEILGQLFPQ